MAGTINIIIWLFYIPMMEAELFALLLGCIYSPISIMGKINLNQINPLEPDRCGGLKFIGRISLISPSVIFAGVSIGTLAFLLRGYLDSPFLRWQIVLIAVWVFGVILLIFPLPIVHKHLKIIKENELKKISDELKILREKTAIEGKQDIKHSIYILQLVSIYNETEKMNEWPFDTNLFQVVLAITIIPLVFQVLAEIISNMVIVP
ncbi:MAG: hypothetical protein L6408_04775 [Nanoarchaeota archaeon]|nr:hypothetical protein [Nanoarchaeota archaeon]